MNGPPTGDFHPIYNAPMLGAHKPDARDGLQPRVIRNGWTREEGDYMSDYKFNCPQCGQRLEAPHDMVGQTIECPTCNGQIPIPQPPMANPPLPELPTVPSNKRRRALVMPLVGIVSLVLLGTAVVKYVGIPRLRVPAPLCKADLTLCWELYDQSWGYVRTKTNWKQIMFWEDRDTPFGLGTIDFSEGYTLSHYKSAEYVVMRIVQKGLRTYEVHYGKREEGDYVEVGCDVFRVVHWGSNRRIRTWKKDQPDRVSFYKPDRSI